MQSVGAYEFCDHAAFYLAGVEPLAVERQGKVIGLYLPLKADKDEAGRRLRRLDTVVDEIVARTGMTDEELAEALDEAK
ncbi:MAG: hypothetical protein ACR2PL_14560 [Dehalococcoidia bacterium]